MMLWEQIKQLEGTCDVEIKSRMDGSGVLIWQVIIEPRADGTPIVVERPDITEAVREGLTRAKSAGLHPH
jgi:hypothetical protein